MRYRWAQVLTGGLAAGALIVAACAPADEPTQAATTTPNVAATAAPGGTTTEPVATAIVAQPDRGQAAATAIPQSSGSGSMEEMNTSVSGIPLDDGAKSGGVLTVASTREGPTFSTWEEAAGIAFIPGHLVSNMVVQFQSWGDADDTSAGAYWNIHPDLATDWEQSSDGLSWTFRFRDGVTIADGADRVPFTCADAKWSLDSIRTGDGLRRSPRGVHFIAIDDIQCADDLTMVISLNRPKAGLLEMIALPYNAIFPKYKYDGNTDDLRETPNVGTGPFTLVEWIPGEKYTYEARDDYWNAPFPYLDGVELLVLGSNAQVAALRAGRLDIGSTAGSVNGARGETLLRECDLCQFSPTITNVGWSDVVHVNHSRAPWNTQAVKDAISLAIDRSKAVELMVDGWGDVPSCGIFHPGTEWCMPENVLKGIPGYDLNNVQANQDQARKLLADAGYAPGDLVVDLRWWKSSEASVPPVAIVEDLQAIGIDATMEPLETALAYDSLTNAEFDVQVHGFFVAGTDPDVPLYEHFYTGSDRNYGRYSNPEVDRMIDQMSETVDPATRKELAWAIGEVVLRDQAKIISRLTTYVVAQNKDVRTFMAAPAAVANYGPWNRFEHVWLDR